jgi:hypothetical protein
VSRTDREHDDNWHKHDDKQDRQRWQRRHRRIVRNSILSENWDRADLRWRRTSGWLTW